MNASIEKARRERIASVFAAAGPRVPAPQREPLALFAAAYFHHLDADDLAARTQRRPARRAAVVLALRRRASRPARPSCVSSARRWPKTAGPRATR